jgi:predicted dehydrogenase
MSERKIGYVGLKHPHRPGYVKTLEQVPAEIVCACEPDDRFDLGDVSGLEGIPVYRDYEELFDAEDVDVAWISASNRRSPAIVEAAVERGLDVFSEKPMARTAAELRPVVEAVEGSDASVVAAYANRSHPAVAELRDRAASGFFGEVRGFELRLVASKLIHRIGDPLGEDVYDRTESRGGVLQWLGCHLIDLVQYVLEDPIARVDAEVRRETDGVDVEDGAVLRVETESGVLGSLHCGYYAREGKDTLVHVTGTRGRAKLPSLMDASSYADRTVLELEYDEAGACAPDRAITYEHDPVPGYLNRIGADYARRFLDAPRDETDVLADVHDAMGVLRVLDAAYESAESGSWTAV